MEITAGGVPWWLVDLNTARCHMSRAGSTSHLLMSESRSCKAAPSGIQNEPTASYTVLLAGKMPNAVDAAASAMAITTLDMTLPITVASSST